MNSFRRIGTQATTDKFSVVTYDPVEQLIPGHIVQSDSNLPFGGLGVFGNNFLEKFEMSKTSSIALKDLTFIDTPAVLSGTYDLQEMLCKYF